MLTALIGYAASKLVCAEGVYHALAHNFVAAALVQAATPTSPGLRTDRL